MLLIRRSIKKSLDHLWYDNKVRRLHNLRKKNSTTIDITNVIILSYVWIRHTNINKSLPMHTYSYFVFSTYKLHIYSYLDVSFAYHRYSYYKCSP